MNALSSTLAEFLETGDSRPLEFEQLPVGQPLYILYSSGTSGKPKCIVHSAGVRISSHLSEFTHFTYLLLGCPHQYEKEYPNGVQCFYGRYILPIHNRKPYESLLKLGTNVLTVARRVG